MEKERRELEDYTMKTILSFSIIATAYVIGTMSGCAKNEPVEGDSPRIEYLSFENEGCGSSNKLSKAHDEAVLYLSYANSVLQVDARFTTQCAAMLKDSVFVSGNTINIFLADTSSFHADCICPLKEVFEFRIEEIKEITILLNYQLSTGTEYYVLADSTIELQ